MSETTNSRDTQLVNHQFSNDIITQLKLGSGDNGTSYSFNAKTLNGYAYEHFATATGLEEVKQDILDDLDRIASGALEYIGSLEASGNTLNTLPIYQWPKTTASHSVTLGNVYVASAKGYLPSAANQKNAVEIDSSYYIRCEAGDTFICKISYNLAEDVLGYPENFQSNPDMYWDIVQGNVDYQKIDDDYNPENHKHPFSGTTDDTTSTYSWTCTNGQVTYDLVIPNHTHTIDAHKHEFTDVAHISTSNTLDVDAIPYKKAKGAQQTEEIDTITITAENNPTAAEANYTPAGTINPVKDHDHELTLTLVDYYGSTKGVTEATTETDADHEFEGKYTPAGTIDQHNHAVDVSPSSEKFLTEIKSTMLQAVVANDNGILKIFLDPTEITNKDALTSVTVGTQNTPLTFIGIEDTIKTAGTVHLADHTHEYEDDIDLATHITVNKAGAQDLTFTGTGASLTASGSMTFTPNLDYDTVDITGIKATGLVNIDAHPAATLNAAIENNTGGLTANTFAFTGTNKGTVTIKPADFGLTLNAHKHAFSGTSNNGQHN